MIENVIQLSQPPYLLKEEPPSHSSERHSPLAAWEAGAISQSFRRKLLGATGELNFNKRIENE